FWDTTTYSKTPIINITPVVSVDWSPDGNYVAMAGDFGIQIVDVVTGITVKHLETGNRHNAVAWHPSGEILVYDGIGGIQEIMSIGVAFAQSTAVISIPIAGEIVIAQNRENLVNIDTVTGAISEYNLPVGAAWSPSFNSDGTQLVYGRLIYDHTILDTVTGSYVEIENFVQLPADDSLLPYGWSSDDANILYFGNHY